MSQNGPNNAVAHYTEVQYVGEYLHLVDKLVDDDFEWPMSIDGDEAFVNDEPVHSRRDQSPVFHGADDELRHHEEICDVDIIHNCTYVQIRTD